MFQNFYFLDVYFFQGDYHQCISRILKGDLMVVPAAPALATIKDDAEYHNSLKNADFAILDSGLLALLLKITTRLKIRKFSGFEFLYHFLEDVMMKESNTIFLVDPSEQDLVINHKYLLKKGFNISKESHYVAPMYGNNVQDHILLKKIERRRPKVVLLNLGGGVQEKLGSFLKNNLSYRPGIICTGAAISFFTGKQAGISKAIDKLYLGWLWRCFDEPRKFIPRYINGFKLIYLYFQNTVEREGYKNE